MALDTYNSQFLQKHSGSSQKTLAFAKSLQILGSSLEEIESTLFGLLHDEANLDHKVSSATGIALESRLMATQTALDVLDFLDVLSSSRREEFRLACDQKFPLSTVFKTADETAALRKEAITPPPEDAQLTNGEDKSEVVS